jgi:Na+/pantothenate symporter
MGKYIFIGYLVIMFGVSIYKYEYGDKGYLGYAYNLGGSLFWPILLIEKL